MKYIELLRRLSDLSPEDLDCEVMVTSLAVMDLGKASVYARLGNLESGEPITLNCIPYDETEPVHTFTVSNEEIRRVAIDYGYKPTDDECHRIMWYMRDDMFGRELFEHYAENDMLGTKNEINWGHATEKDLMAAHYTGDAYMAIPYYFYTYPNDDVVDDVAGSNGYYYKSPYDVDMTVVDVVRGVGEVPAEDGIRIGVRIIRDHFENGANTGTDMDNDIWFDDEKGEWNRDELRYF